MYLKRITLLGFKSFSRETTLSFTTPVTAIVGPNGSGKSNIAEALRFVLGEQSMKSLRSKRGEDLIFNGSKSLARANKASVSIVFDNSKKTFPFDYDEVELKRVVYRDTTNQYFLNGSRVRLKDIIEALSSIHVGASSHHIISQGEADRILNASIKERRIMIEDALGLRVYQYKKAESERKLAKTEENIEQVESLRKEIAPHLRFLEKQVKKLEEAQDLKTQLIELYKDYFGGESGYLKWQKELLHDKRKGPQKMLQEVEESLREKSDALSKLQGEEEKNEDIVALEKRLVEIGQERDEHSRRLGRLEGMLEYEEKKKTKKKNVSSEGEREVRINKDELKKFITSLRDFLADVSSMQSLEGVKEKIASFETTAESFYALYRKPTEIEHKEEEREEEENSYEHLKSQKELLEGKVEALQKEEAELSSKKTMLTQTLQKEQKEERQLESELFELRTKKTELLSELELVSVREERLLEDEKRFNEERVEAGHLLGHHVARYEEIRMESVENIEDFKKEQETKRRSAEKMKVKIEDLGGGGEDLMKEYEEVKERSEYLERELGDLEKSITSLKDLISELNEKIEKEFKEGVVKINKEFGRLFETMFEGGTAKISLITPPPKRKKDDELSAVSETEEDVFEEDKEEGIDILVNLPQKRLKGLHMLSGGERTLTSIALVFALSLVNPPPFLVLDETDAALDESNSKKYGKVIKDLSAQTQFIIITHNREMMAGAQVLYGVTTGSDATSRLLSIKFEEAEEMVA